VLTPETPIGSHRGAIAPSRWWWRKTNWWVVATGAAAAAVGIAALGFPVAPLWHGVLTGTLLVLGLAVVFDELRHSDGRRGPGDHREGTGVPRPGAPTTPRGAASTCHVVSRCAASSTVRLATSGTWKPPSEARPATADESCIGRFSGPRTASCKGHCAGSDCGVELAAR
jgi:hypothetical protein